jgi:hypothetical protein
MLAAAIAAPKISFETLGMIPSPRNKTMLCYCRAEDWITSLQIPSQFLEHNAELHCTRGAANRGEFSTGEMGFRGQVAGQQSLVPSSSTCDQDIDVASFQSCRRNSDGAPAGFHSKGS